MASRSGLRYYVLTRLLLAIPMLLILLTILFVLLRVAPGDPVYVILGQHATPQQIARTRHLLGFDQPLWKQYLSYLWDTAHGNLGSSYVNAGVSTWTIIQASFPATLELTFWSMVIALGVGLLVGAASGARRNSKLDVAGRVFGIVAYATPIFWLGILGILVFSTYLGWLPPGGRIGPRVEFEHPFPQVTGLYLVDTLLAGDWVAFGDVLTHLILPATTLGLVISGIFIRITRVNMLQTMQSDYVEAARMRGVAERTVVVRHAFRNALVPVVTLVGMTFALLLGGAILTEVTFNWPGLARQLIASLGNRDFPVVQGVVTFFALIIVLVSILIDVLNAFLDPRIRY